MPASSFLFIPCGRLSWLPVSFLLHVKYTLSYRIVSYRIVVKLFDVEYYRDLEMSITSHSVSLKMVLFESFGTVFYSPSIVTTAVSLTISEIFSVKELPNLRSWV